MLVTVLITFAVGLVVQRVEPRARDLTPWLDHAVISVTLPALILAKLPDLEMGADLLVPVAAAWGSGALAVVVVVVAGRRLGWGPTTIGALLLVTPLGNTTFLGLAMVESLLGPAELARALAFDQMGTFAALTIYGSVIAARWGAGGGSWGQVLARLVRFPPFIAVVVSFGLRAVELPGGLDGALGDLGSLMAPIAMLTVGLRFKLRLPTQSRVPALWCLVTKMVVMPGAVMAAAALAGGLDDPAWTASVLESGMPPMVTAGVIATQAGFDEDLATGVVGLGLLAALVTIPLWTLGLR